MTTEPYSLRLALPEDIPATLSLKAACWREAYAGLRPESFFADHEARLDKEADWWRSGLEAGAELWIATTADGTIIGTAGGAPVLDDDADTGVEVELQMLYVLAAHHGTGLGLALMRRVTGDAPALLWVLEGNPRAEAFYAKHGFVRDGRTEQLTGDWAGLSEVRMVRGGKRG